MHTTASAGVTRTHPRRPVHAPDAPAGARTTPMPGTHLASCPSCCVQAQVRIGHWACTRCHVVMAFAAVRRCSSCHATYESLTHYASPRELAAIERIASGSAPQPERTLCPV